MQEEPGDTGSGERTKCRILRGLGREFFRRFGSLVAELHRQHGYRVLFNDNPRYPQILEILEEVQIPNTKADVSA